MNKILIYCIGCKKSYNVNRENEIPNNVISLECNWCPSCEDSAEDDYEEKYIYEPKEDVINVAPNQLKLEL